MCPKLSVSHPDICPPTTEGVSNSTGPKHHFTSPNAASAMILLVSGVASACPQEFRLLSLSQPMSALPANLVALTFTCIWRAATSVPVLPALSHQHLRQNHSTTLHLHPDSLLSPSRRRPPTQQPELASRAWQDHVIAPLRPPGGFQFLSR